MGAVPNYDTILRRGDVRDVPDTGGGPTNVPAFACASVGCSEQPQPVLGQSVSALVC